VRVYLPTTLVVLARLLEDGELGPAPLTGYAVTPALREWYVSGDMEELEYAAMAEAAQASLRLLALDGDAPSRRVVLAVEVPDGGVTHGSDLEERAEVRLTAPVALSTVAAGHVDDAEAESDIRAARVALAAADAGDDDALFTVDGAAGHELLWYASQELPFLIKQS
jgi:hypothetical protein